MRTVLRALCPLLILVATASTAAGAERLTRGLRYPTLTPDGKSVVFCYRGDLWIAPVDGKGHVDRLTIHEAQDTLPRVSPDGTKIAFSSKRNGNYDIFVIPIDGGVPERLTFHSAYEAVCDWSPDGKSILFTSERSADRGRTDLYEVSVDGGTPRRITFDGAREGAYSPDGKQVVYVRGFLTIYWDDYNGAANYDVYVTDRKGSTPRRLTETDGNERWPFFSADGKTVYFLAEERKVANFYSMPAAGGARTKLTMFRGADVHRPDQGWDFKTFVFERNGNLYRQDLTVPNSKFAPIKISIRSDERNSGIDVRTITSGGEQVHVSADGRRLAFTLHGDLWTMAANGGDAQRITSGPSKDQWPRFSPDGTKIAYFANKRGNEDIFLLDLKTGRSTAVTKHRAGDFFHNWSPDGKSLVFCSQRSGNKDIWLVDLESGQKTQLTRDASDDDDPTFSPDGKHIAFDSGRAGTQAIYVMDADGGNVRRVTGGAGFNQVPSFSPDGNMLVYEAMVPGSPQPGGLFVTSVQGGPSMRISRDGSTACWSAQGDFIYFTANRGRGNDGVFRVKAPESVEAGERVPFVGRIEVDRKKELETLFDEAWTALGAGFYDAKMHGVDWREMRKKYRPMAIDAENKDEFQNIVRQMLGELGASHLGIFGGSRQGSSAAPRVDQTGYLGLDFETESLEDGSRKVARVLPGGPADQAGLRVGDVVVRIGKTALKGSTNLDRLLTGTVGNELVVSYRPRSADGLGHDRTARLRPVHLNQVRQLKYKAWTAASKRRVDAAIEGKKKRLVYVHLNAMNPKNLQKFQSAVARWNSDGRVRGMVLDIRDNGGGNIHNQLISILNAKPLAKVTMRGGQSVTQPTMHWDKPVVVLINERSFSDAEVFPFMFRAAGLGKLVGVPTAGGVIGTNNITLSDGSSFRIPRTGFRGMGGRNLEGLGVKPDLLVEETAEDRRLGRDPQLDKAIEVLLAEIAGRAKAAPPAPEPKETPVEPEATPAPTPAPEPKPVATAIDPLADVQVGEWVRYRLSVPGAEEETLLRITVDRIQGDAVYFGQRIEKGGKLLPPLPDRLTKQEVLKSLPMLGKVHGHSVVEGRVNDAATEILTAQVRMFDGSEVELRFTNLVPAYGLYQVRMGKAIVLEAIAWGIEAAPETPASQGPAKGAQPEAAEAPAKATEPEMPAHPLRDAQTGEWIRYRQTMRNREFDVVVRVVEANDDEVVLERAITLGERTQKAPPQRVQRKERLTAPRNQEVETIDRETVTWEEEEYECFVLTSRNANGIEFKYWFCDRLPVDGILKVERDGVVVRELIEAGNEEE